MQQNPFNRPTNQPDSYKTLIVFRKSECVYDITFYFVSRFLDRGHDRTVDQMQQAARSGKQNIVEGYSDAEGSTEIEHKLTVIAKGSLEELKEDYYNANDDTYSDMSEKEIEESLDKDTEHMWAKAIIVYITTL